MRIKAVNVRGVGGLVDSRVPLPEEPIAALAGANGTGKSKLLACILAPWTGQIPSPRDEQVDAEVLVEVTFTATERDALSAFSERIGWGPANIPEECMIGVERGLVIGQRRVSMPPLTVIANALGNPQFLSANPTLDVLYLPAERRLVEPRQQGIDLNQLSDEVLLQKGAESRAAVGNYGRLDDQEFESFAKALCVAASLPADDAWDDNEERPSAAGASRIVWSEFKALVDALIAPKELLGLTRSHPDQLRIRTPQGETHPVRELSSGERQALIIVSRVFGTESGRPIVMIDEPDAYLHPNLSKRLILALEDGVGPDGQLVIATHSPAILDGVPPSSILRLEFGGPPVAISDETDRLDLYRAAGFRSSALTQSDLLLITEGPTDIAILGLAIPELNRASILPAGGKAQVFRQVELLAPFDLPVVGVVDRDLNLSEAPESVRDSIFAWPTADIEGLYLSETSSLASMIEHGMIKQSYSTVDKLVQLVNQLCDELRENVIAEIARAEAVRRSGYEWPSPRGADAVNRLRRAVSAAAPIALSEIDVAIARAETIWDEAQNNRLRVVRGKYILAAFASAASEMKSGRALIEATARHQPSLAAMNQLAALVDRHLKVA